MEDLTNDERKRLAECMKDSEFMNLLAEYAKEISDPKHRLENEQYLRQLEQEQGAPLMKDNAVVMIPDACFCVETRSNKSNCAVFINICSSDKVERMTETKRVSKGHQTGSSFRIPLALGQVKQDTIQEKGSDSTAAKCLVYDVVFHPETAIQALSSVRFRDMIIELSMEQIEKSFAGELLDRKRIIPYGKASEGDPSPQTIRISEGASSQHQSASPSSSNDPTDKLMEAFERSFQGKSLNDFDTLKLPDNPSPPTISKTTNSTHSQSQTRKTLITEISSKDNDEQVQYMTPQYNIIHRGQFSMDQHTMHQLTPVHNMPAELVIQISLPRRENASQIDLDIGTKSLSLVDEKCRYKLEVELPFQVDEESGTARFEKKNRTLTVTLSVIQPKVEPLPFIEPEQTIEEQEEVEERNEEQQTEMIENPKDNTEEVKHEIAEESHVQELNVESQGNHVQLDQQEVSASFEEIPNDDSLEDFVDHEEQYLSQSEIDALVEKTRMSLENESSEVTQPESINPSSPLMEKPVRFFDTTFTNRYLQEID